MRAWRIILCAAGAVALSALASSAVQREERPRTQQRVYRVTTWPDNTPDQPYREQVERHLNEMVSQGWKLHGSLAAQGAKMLVFERVASQ